MKLKQNLYGCKQAANNWFRNLTKGLLKRGFTQPKTDQCLFLSNDCILVVYADLADVGIQQLSNCKDTPADSILYVDTSGPDRVDTWNY